MRHFWTANNLYNKYYSKFLNENINKPNNMRKIEEIESQIKDLLKEVESLKKQEPKFEAGKWYVVTSVNNYKYLFNYQSTTNNQYIGFGYNYKLESWITSPLMETNQLQSITPATPSEIETALIAEAKRRGFKDNLIIKDAKYKEKSPPQFGHYRYIADQDGLTNDMSWVYYQGQWAEIIQEDKIMIGDAIAEFRDGGVWFNRHQYSKKELQSLVEIFDNHADQIKSINVGCNGQYKVDYDMLNKLLNNCK